MTRLFGKNNGFTIVELLVVIVVIGILAAITVVAFSGVRNRAINNASVAEAVAWDKQLKLYKATFGTFPAIANGDYCLGTGFPDGDGAAGGECRSYTYEPYQYHENDSTALHNELKKVGSLPSGPRKPINDVVGPYMSYWNTGYYMNVVLHGGPNDCPPPTKYTWDDGAGMLLCYIQVDQ